MPRDVLIVDDVKSALDQLGNEVRLKLGIEPFLADDPNQALDILRYYPIKVLVTDQRMSQMTGTQLVRKAREELDLQMPCILITAYSDTVDVAEAINVGIFRFIDKMNAPAELAQAVRQAIQTYDMGSLLRSAIQLDVVLAQKKSILALRPQVALRLTTVTSIDHPYVRARDWGTYLRAERGLSGKHETLMRHRASSHCEHSVEVAIIEKCGFELGRAIARLKAGLEGKAELTTTAWHQRELVIEVKHTLDVQAITDQPTEEGLTLYSRHYQSAPVYSRINCILQLECSCCKIPRQFDLSVNLPTNSIALRQVEYYDKGAPRTIYTGFASGQVVDSGLPV